MESQVIRMINNTIIMNKNDPHEYDIEVFNITKRYRLRERGAFITALEDINFKVKNEEIFGLLGPNGAGKTTLISILTTLIQPTSGSATILGRDVLKDAWFVRENVGLMLGGDMVYHRLTGYRNLIFFAKLYGIKDYKKKINELAELLNLNKWLKQYVYSFSTGMKLKLALARILLIDPKILILDEPMLGLDPKSIREVIELLLNLKKTIIITSHQMNIVSKMCDRIAFLKEGKILKIDTQENFKRLIKEKIKIELKLTKQDSKFLDYLKNLDFISDVKTFNDDISFFIDNESYYSELFKFLKDYPIKSFNEHKPDLNEVFIKLIE